MDREEIQMSDLLDYYKQKLGERDAENATLFAVIKNRERTIEQLLRRNNDSSPS